jgi:hypothetical protein
VDRPGPAGTSFFSGPIQTLLERLNSYNTGLPDFLLDCIQKDARGNLVRLIRTT